jgi:hypothetical protein
MVILLCEGYLKWRIWFISRDEDAHLLSFSIALLRDCHVVKHTVAENLDLSQVAVERQRREDIVGYFLLNA